MRGEGLYFSIATRDTLREIAENTLGKGKRLESEWKELVRQGLARLVTTKELNGYRQHYEMV